MLKDLDAKLAACNEEDGKGQLSRAMSERETSVIGVYRQVKEMKPRSLFVRRCSGGENQAYGPYPPRLWCVYLLEECGGAAQLLVFTALVCFS